MQSLHIKPTQPKNKTPAFPQVCQGAVLLSSLAAHKRLGIGGLLVTGVLLWQGAQLAAQGQPLGAETVRVGEAAVLASTAQDALMQQARVAYQRRDSAQLAQILPQVQGHTLAPWVTYWLSNLRLQEASADEMQRALDSIEGTYQEDRLRNDWLLHLGKTQQWGLFAQQFPKFRMRDDSSVACYAWIAQIQQPQMPLGRLAVRQLWDEAQLLEASEEGPQTAAAFLRDHWLPQKEADEGCAALAQQQWQDKLVLSPSTASLQRVIWERARIGVEMGKLRMATQAVGIVAPELLADVNALYRNPESFLDDKLLAIAPRSKELVTLALVRLAATQADSASQKLDSLQWRAQLSQDERDWVWGILGKRAAQRLSSSESLQLFAKADKKHLNDEALAWYARAALREGNWQLVQEVIVAMSVRAQNQPVWKYWGARAAKALEGAVSLRAQVAFEQLASTQGFYELLAMEELGQAIQAPAAPAAFTAAEVAATRRNAGLQRAVAAMQLNWRSEAVREWNYQTVLHNLDGMTDRELLAAARWACELQWWDRCINTSERTQTLVDVSTRFPTPFRESIEQAARTVGLNPANVLGLIRQESRFNPVARSGVGAAGLMQVMPATASWTAKRFGIEDFQPSKIALPETNLRLGTTYLRYVLDELDGSWPMAAAAYNAGPNRPRNWRNGPVLEGAIWAENVPFSETRDYVKKVSAGAVMYGAVLTGQPQSLKALLGKVGPPSQPNVQPDNTVPQNAIPATSTDVD